ncbi:MAG: hypothetical protein JSR61_01550 [Proteobacteria bacterium]|nr:hypothetical protein [Pseudomonadota bacterium]
MDILPRVLFVIAGIAAGSTAVNYFVFGNTADYGLPNGRLGAWREAKVRTACFPALEFPQQDAANPKLPQGDHRIDRQDYMRMVDMTAALHCYLVSQRNAVCDPNNRAYIVDYASKYFAKMDDMIAVARRYDENEVGNVRQLWNSPNNRAVMAAFDDHIRNGRLMKGDFGFSMPAPLVVIFAKYPQAADQCRQERPAAAGTT